MRQPTESTRTATLFPYTTRFRCVAELATPWRWRNVDAEARGQWLLEVRRLLAAGQQVDLRTGPPAHVTWVQAVPPNDHPQRLAAARTLSPTDRKSTRLNSSH